MSSRRVIESGAQVRRDLAAMWTGPVDVTSNGARALVDGSVVHEFTAYPSAGRPRLVVSSRSRAAQAATVRRFSHSTGLAGRAARLVLAAGIRTGALERVLGGRLSVVADEHGRDGGPDEAPSLIARLAEIFGTDIVVAMAVGAVRANRKPVLHVLAPDGRALGFAKLGVSPLAAELVKREAANLRFLAARPLRHVQAPAVVHEGTWAGHPLLVMSALRTPLRRRHRPTRLPVAAMAELAEVDETPTLHLGGTEWLDGARRAAVTGAREGDANSSRFLELLARLGDRHGERQVRFGSWHGDWGPWNMAWGRDRVLLWDWERFTRGVPYGLDALHYSLPDLPRRRRSLPALRRTAAAVLRPFGIPTDDVPLVLSLYVTALCARYVPDSRTPQGHQLQAQVAGLLDVLETLS